MSAAATNYKTNTTPVVFTKLENAQNVEKIARIFARDKPNYELKPNPHFVIVVGAPGVGKTTKTREIIKNELNLNYDDFYNISLDSLVERVKPYRNVTKRLYNTLKNKKLELEALNYNTYSDTPTNELSDKNFGILSEVYLPTIMSKKSNFSLTATETAKKMKIAALGSSSSTSGKTQGSVNRNISTLKNLIDLRKEGLIYGVQNELNIIYDTTFRPNKNIIDEDIMPILTMNTNVKYKITVILITANIPDIQSRIKGRHMQMLSEPSPYIRAIDPQLTTLFVKQNKLGFDIAKKYFTSNSYSRSFYNKNDFKFIEVLNPSKNNKSKTLKKPIHSNYSDYNNFKYF
jgi:hypothetical protein